MIVLGEMEFHWLDGGNDGGYNGAGFLEVNKIIRAISFDTVDDFYIDI